MQSWFKSFAACGVAVLVVHNVAAQVKIQVQPVPAPNIQMIQGRADGVFPVYGNSPNRLAASDAVFVGRVVALEPMDIEAVPAKGQAKIAYRIAVIQVTEMVRGLKKDVQTVRVGFPVVSNNGQPGVVGVVQIQPALPGGALIRRPFVQTMTLQVGQDGLFFLAKHAEESFFLAPTYQNFVTRQNNANFDNEVKSAKQVCKVLDNPLAALKSEDKEDRYTAAAVLVSKYRSSSNPGLPMKQEPIDAQESKRILKALAEGDWTIGRFNATVPGPYELFNHLGITAQDGYQLVNVRNQQDIIQGMQKWLEANADKYRVKKLVADPNAKALPLPQPGAAVGGVRLNRQVQPPAPIPPVPAPKDEK